MSSKFEEKDTQHHSQLRSSDYDELPLMIKQTLRPSIPAYDKVYHANF